MRAAVWSTLLVACAFSPNVADDGAPSDARVDASDAPDAAGDAVINTIDAPACPADFVAVAGSRYKPIVPPASFAGAVGVCAALGARVHLARLDSPQETSAVYGLLDDAIIGGDTHIYRVVGSRKPNGAGAGDDTWHDLDGTELAFQPWGANEPTNLGGEDCMSLREEFSGAPPPKVTGADNCTTSRAFACECD